MISAAAERPLAAIVLVSDGLDTSAIQGSATEDKLVASGVPVFTIGVGAETIADDLALTDVRVAAESMPGSITSATMDIRHDGPATARVRVFDGTQLLYADTVELESGEHTRHQIGLRLERTGFHDLRFDVRRDGIEPMLGNNSLSRTVRVSDRRYRVLHVEGEPRWEYKFLRRALADDSGVELVSWLKVSPNKYYRQGIDNADELLAGFPRSAAELYQYDAVIIGSVEAATLSPLQQQLLHDFVSVRGGALMLLGGSSGLGNGGWGESLLAPALPAQLPAYGVSSFQRARVPVLLTPAGAASAFLTLDDNNTEAWQTLPELADYQTTGKLKPAAVSLLDVRTDTGRQPLLITQPYGNGRTFIMATGGTWRWQMSLPAADLRHETFWRQLLRELVSATDTRSSVSLSADKSNQLLVRARFLGPDWRPQNATLSATLSSANGEAQALALTPVAGSDWYEATTEVDGAGLYYAEVRAERDGTVLDVARASARLDNRAAEDARIRRDAELLQHLAELTGGKYLAASDVSSLASSIQASAAGVTSIQRLPVVEHASGTIGIVSPKISRLVAAPAMECDMKRLLGLWVCCWPLSSPGATDIMIVQGLPGESRYATQFAKTSDALQHSANTLANSGAKLLRGAAATRQNVLGELATRQSTLSADDVFVLYLIGHGSWDDETYKFNVAGPDITATDLATALDAIPAQTQLVVSTGSASGAMLDTLGSERRILVSATRSGAERHATRFGQFFADSLSDARADVDKDQRISAAEAFAFAERHVADYYAADQQLATEHPRLLGDRAGALVLARLDSGGSGSDATVSSPAVAAALAKRDAANGRIEALKLNRESLPGENYQQQLRRALLELAIAEETLEQARSEETP